jgi:hypothetical protein
LQERQERAGHLHNAPEINAKQPVEIALRDLKESAAKRYAGVVDQNVDATVLGRYLRGKS